MKSLLYIFSFLLSVCVFGQDPKTEKNPETKKDSTALYFIIGNDSIMRTTLELDEVVVTGSAKDKQDEDRKRFLILQRRVLKVFPYAKSGADNLIMLQRNMDRLKTEKEKKKYFKIVENYLEKEFEAQLKKLSRKEGQILIKLIYRQTGRSSYDLIKDLKSGWKAFWSNNTAKLFDLDLKATYNPYEVSEDFLIESILLKAFSEGRLDRQPSAFSINYKELHETWNARMQAESVKK
jgi:hypothetical protein